MILKMGKRYVKPPTKGEVLSVSTKNPKLNTLRSYFNWPEREKYITVNPMTNIKDLKMADVKKM
ncbi:hypothetical protein ACQCWI_21815 [Bacillus thuringiensis]|nr:hypothetical protein [Bacillus cereus]